MASGRPAGGLPWVGLLSPLEAVPRRAADRRHASLSPTLHPLGLTQQQQGWLDTQRGAGKRVVAVELADGVTSLTRLVLARTSTVLLLGHEHGGIPDDVLAQVDECVEIPMIGVGASRNVALAGSLVAYRLAGLS